MAEVSKPEIVLYDLACTKNACFSPVVWRIRMMLNYKRIPYTTVFLEFPDIEPTLRGLPVSPLQYCVFPITNALYALRLPRYIHNMISCGIVPGEAAAGRYTVPAIKHVATDTYIMDSTPISQFLESNWPEPPLPLKSELGIQVQTKMFAAAVPAMLLSVRTREPNILSPRAREYFHRNLEARLGHPVADVSAEEENRAWDAADEELRAVEKLLQTHQAEGPFITGATPTYSDFRIAGSIESGRMVDESIFQRIVKYPGFKALHEACQPYMETRS